MAAFLLLIELIDRIRSPAAAVLALTMEAWAVDDEDPDDSPNEPRGKGVPAAMAFLSVSFAACALTIAGLPPLSGFVAKFGMFHALLNPEGEAVRSAGWTLMALVFVSGLISIISMLRFGVRTFWANSGATRSAPPRLHRSEVMPVVFLLALSAVMTVEAGPIFGYLGRAGAGIQRPADYVARVLGTTPVPGPATVVAGEAP